jgi:streptogramin lyase
MMPVSFSRGLVTAAALALLAGCSGAQQVAPSPASGVQSLSRHSAASGPAHRYLGAFALTPARLAQLRSSGIKVPHVAAPSAHRTKWGHTLFVADYIGNVVQQFDPKPGGQVLATISDVVGPQGMDADSHGNLYVTSQGTAAVNVYTPGTYTASTILNEGNGQAPASVAVCPNGTVYVSNTYANSGFDLGSIEIFAHGATSPTGTIADSNIYFSFFVACDAHGNVWYDFLDTNFVTGVAEYVPSTQAITEFGNLGIAFPGGIRAIERGRLSINDQSTSQFDGTVQIFDTSNMAAGPVKTITGFADPVSGSWGPNDKGTWQADISNQNVEFAQPKGSPQIKYTIGGGVLQGPVDAYVFPAGDR